MKNYLNGTLLFNRLYLTYVLPRKKLSKKLTRLLDSEQLGVALNHLYDELILRNPDKDKFGEVCFLAFNRLFDIESSINLGVAKQLENTAIQMIQSSPEFTNSIFKHKSTVLSLDSPFEESGLDFYDREELYSLHPSDHELHYLMLPVFLINTTNYDRVIADIFKPYKDPLRTQDLSQNMIQNYISKHLGSQLAVNDHFYMSLAETEKSALKYAVNTGKQMLSLSVQEDSKKNMNE